MGAHRVRSYHPPRDRALGSCGNFGHSRPTDQLWALPVEADGYPPEITDSTDGQDPSATLTVQCEPGMSTVRILTPDD
jgi:hypothetical protein